MPYGILAYFCFDHNNTCPSLWFHLEFEVHQTQFYYFMNLVIHLQNTKFWPYHLLYTWHSSRTPITPWLFVPILIHEPFHFFCIVPIEEVLLLEVLIELLPHNLPLIYILDLSTMIPLYRYSSIQIEYGHACLHVLEVVLDLEILPHPKNPSLNSFTWFGFTIKNGKFFLPKFPMWVIIDGPFPLIPMRCRTWVSTESLEENGSLEGKSGVYVLSCEKPSLSYGIYCENASLRYSRSFPHLLSVFHGESSSECLLIFGTWLHSVGFYLPNI